MQIVILAGGLGTRLRQVVSDRPKSMAIVNGKPFLEHLIIYLHKQGFRDLLICSGYKHDMIKDYFQDGTKFDVRINYSLESEPLGTGGALKNAYDLLEKEFLVVNGDVLMEVQYTDFVEFHKKNNSNISLAVTKVVNPERFGVIILDSNNNITSFVEKGITSKEVYVNAGAYLIKKDSIDWLSLPNHFSLERDVFACFKIEKPFLGYLFSGYYIDIGIPKDFEKLQNEIGSLFWLYD